MLPPLATTIITLLQEQAWRSNSTGMSTTKPNEEGRSECTATIPSVREVLKALWPPSSKSFQIRHHWRVVCSVCVAHGKQTGFPTGEWFPNQWYSCWLLTIPSSICFRAPWMLSELIWLPLIDALSKGIKGGPAKLFTWLLVSVPTFGSYIEAELTPSDSTTKSNEQLVVIRSLHQLLRKKTEVVSAAHLPNSEC